MGALGQREGHWDGLEPAPPGLRSKRFHYELGKSLSSLGACKPECADPQGHSQSSRTGINDDVQVHSRGRDLQQAS